MKKVEVYIDDKETPADIEAVRFIMSTVAEEYGIVRHTRVKEMSSRQIGFGDLEKGEIASCEGVKLLYRDGHYIVETDKLIRNYWFAYTAVNGFAEQINDALHDRMRTAGIEQPSFEDMQTVPPGYEERTWVDAAMQATIESDE